MKMKKNTKINKTNMNRSKNQQINNKVNKHSKTKKDKL